MNPLPAVASSSSWLTTNPWLSVIPPLIAVLLVVLTKRVGVSLGLGIVTAALVISDGNPVEAARSVGTALVEIFWVVTGDPAERGFNDYNALILLFLLLLGVITAFITMSGGARAFADWASGHIHTRRGAQGLPAILGCVIFIDDYFNALAVGQISKPVTDAHRVSRAKLSYLIDSTAAPVCVIAPFSSWGAGIILIIAPIVAAAGLDHSPLAAFLATMPMNYYAWAALALVALVVVLGVDAGPMLREEERTLRTGDSLDPELDAPGEMSADLPVKQPGRVWGLLAPFVALTLGVVAALFVTGHRTAVEAGVASPSVMEMFENTQVTHSLVWGGLIGLAVALAVYLVETVRDRRFGWTEFGRGWVDGARSMLPAIIVLVLAWITAALISQMGTGEYVAGLVERSGLDAVWLPALLFLVAGGIAFATGTSWGSFGILLPIAGDLVTHLQATEMVIPVLGAVLAGAVLGDHCSPISDTTILSATGAGAPLTVHVNTQLPYALLGGLASTIGYLVLGATGNGWVGLAVTLGVLVLAVLGLRATGVARAATA
ncbi:Na+/H+ antiporter NhaC [Kytococcus aerolatus]|uniref:Na+/H+ antiporter NhaC n=1 Tax=Kytococcus aerolatus TaxID=592308 RepID=A0A212TZF4_9MICO|nr:Na+/H+ antiporter NhaC family protein [Kytococcus aerolatus]SNC71359.1 Na+/H+ antiporter NhaC [Kytococcus aerolatus]